MEHAPYDRYPVWIVIVSNALGLGIWAIGAGILSGFGILWSLLYLAYCVWIEFRVLRSSCVNCHYYGGVCAFGKGLLCALLFKKGDPGNFASHQISWKDLVPDFMVSLIPLAGGIVLLIRQFSWPLMFMLGLLLLLSSWGNAFVRGRLACSHCRQLEIGCPAAKLFAVK